MYLYERIDTWDRNNLVSKKNKTARPAGTRREHGRGRPRQSRQSTGRRVRQGSIRPRDEPYRVSSQK